MKKIIVEGGHTLSGTINIGGAKNSAVALIPAAILCSGTATIFNVPQISDSASLIEILEYLGAKVNLSDDTMTINSTNIKNKEIPEEISKNSKSYTGLFLKKIFDKEN